MIGTDSHTPNAGGLGMLAIGVGGIDASELEMPILTSFVEQLAACPEGRTPQWQYTARVGILTNLLSLASVVAQARL